MTERRAGKRTASLGASFLAFLLYPPSIYAQTDSEVGAGIEFNFLNPGARSLGMGGAFLAVADDATAAFTNPAGVALLGKPEVSVEGRGFQFTQIFLDAGRSFGSPATGVGVDTMNFLENGEAESNTSGLSFLSFVYPGDGWALAVYRRQAANFEADFEAQGAFIQDLGVDLLDSADDGTVSRVLPYRAQLDLEMVDLGVSFAARMGKVYAGVGASFYKFRLQSVTKHYRLFSDGDAGCSEIEALPGGFCGPPLFEDGSVPNLQTTTGDSRDVGVNVGILWKISDRANFAAVYRQGPTFDVTASTGSEFGKEHSTQFHVPDVFGLGLAFYPMDAMSISFDYDRVQYSQMTEDFLVLFPEIDVRPDEFQVSDGNEFHLGFEYGLVKMRYPVVFRLGVWTDPDHKLRYEGRNTVNRALFQGGSDAVHYAGGAGIVFGERFQIDAAYDYSSRIRTFSLSMVLRF